MSFEKRFYQDLIEGDIRMLTHEPVKTEPPETRRRSLNSGDAVASRALKIRGFLDGLDTNMTRAFLPWIIRNPRYLRTFTRFRRVYQDTRRLRAESKKNGLVVPPFMIMSITSRCNLRCTGCYASANGTVNGSTTSAQLDRDQWRRVFSQARELGVLGFIVAGGEPFMFPDLVDLCQEFKDRFFVIVSNGTSITEADFAKLGRSTNIGVVVSLEGGRSVTDARRGEGVYDKAMATIGRLLKAGVFTGVSVTVTKRNLSYWMDEANVDAVTDLGVRLGVFIEYIPDTPSIADALGRSCPGLSEFLTDIGETPPGDADLTLSREEQGTFRRRILDYRGRKPIYIIHSPADEAFFGGCVSAGRGFAHVTPTGDLTPCPVSNLATHNLSKSTLREGLSSPLFSRLRESDLLNSGHATACALASHQKETEEIARSVGAYRSGAMGKT